MINNLNEFFLTIWDSNFNALGIVDNIISLQWTKSLNEIGNFSLSVPLNEENVEFFKLGNLVSKSTFRREGDLLEPYIITYVSLSVDNDGVENLQIQGVSLLNWLSQRVISDIDKDVIEDTVFNILKELISSQCIDPKDENRIIPNLTIGESNNLYDRTTYTISKYNSLLQSISSICQSKYYGIEILMNIREKKYIVNIFKCEDKTLRNIESPVVFSENLNNIISNGYVTSNVNYKNTAYAYGEIDFPKSNKDINKEVVIEYPLAVTFSGLERYETAVNCSSPDINGKKIKLTEENFQSIGQALAEENLSLNQENKSFTATLNIHSNLIYRKDFNVGDIVTCINKDWGLNMNSLIVSVSEEYSVNGVGIVITFGYPLPTIIKRINSKFTRRL